MQSLFNRHKRKHDESAGSEGGNKKHKSHTGNNGEESRISKSMERARIDPRPSMSSSTSPAQSRKIANLIKALDEALEEDGMDQTLDFIGDEALNRCLDLRTSLSSARSKLDDELIKKSSTSREQKSHDFFNIPKTFSPYSLEPWKSSTIPTTLPPLPEILDRTLERSAFMHIGCGSGHPTDLSYERLEWIGDAYIELISTLLISQTFPFLLPGKQSQIRERLVKNVTLAEFSRQYGFDKRLVLPDPKIFSVKLPDMTKILGDIFEAYVAAIILSDPQTGVARASQWLKDIWGMTIAKEIIHEERTGFKFDSPMWKLRGAYEPEQELASKEEKQCLNPKDQLKYLIGSKGVNISYNEAATVKKDPTNKLPLFTVGVYLSGYGEKDKLLGTGQGNGKKDAGFKAAEMVMANKKLMKVYGERKRLADAQLKLEQEALDAQ
ncbi:ribonuclease III domain-containing protein [Rhexocercosporidium sp. MPI-PUGE-AT-0058]|nr:ribonuclease III domain-containing protein [Rhexocercosporidium sp. MPI-PUGE-AT-0058]